MKNQNGVRNMTTGGVRRVIISFALPVFLSQLFQQLYNTADSLIVGNILGKQALAAVSSSSALLLLLTSLMAGISIGAGVVISRYFGAGEEDNVSIAIHTTVTFGLILGAFMTAFGVVLSPVLLKWMGTAPDVMEGSVAYFRNYFYGAMGVVMYNIFMGIMNALGDSRRPLLYLIFSSLLNIVLDLLFVGKMGLDVGWAAIATAISQAASALLCFLHLRKPGTLYQIIPAKLRLHRSMLLEVIRYGLPAGVQNSVISIANVLIQSYINSFGSDAMAACGTFSKLEGFAFLPITSFAMAMTTFIGQNLGAHAYDRAKKGARFGTISALVLSELIGALMLIFAPALIRLFNDSPEVVRIATMECRVECLFFGLMAFSHAVAGVCRGAGRSTVPMLVMLAAWCVIRIIYITIAMRIRHDIVLLFWAYPITWTISSIVFLIYYLKSDWVHAYERKHAFG